MPFTFAHPAIILPFKYLPKHRYSLSGLIVGSMTPDFEYFIRMQVKSIYSHTLPGLFWFDVPLGLVLTFVYLLLVKDPLIRHLPILLNRRFSAYARKTVNISANAIAIVTLSVLIGAASHLLWDGFTHPTGYFVKQIPALSSVAYIGSNRIFIYKILQHGSTITGLAIILFTALLLPKKENTKAKNIARYWLTIALTSILTVVLRLLTGLSWQQYSNLLVTSIAGGFIGLIIASVILTRNNRINIKVTFL